MLNYFGLIFFISIFIVGSCFSQGLFSRIKLHLNIIFLSTDVEEQLAPWVKEFKMTQMSDRFLTKSNNIIIFIHLE